VPNSGGGCVLARDPTGSPAVTVGGSRNLNLIGCNLYSDSVSPLWRLERHALTTFGQCLCRFGAFGGLDNQFGYMNTQRFGDAIEDIDCRIFQLPLKASQVGAVNPGLISQFLLRNTAIHAELTHIQGHKRTSFHAPSMSCAQILKPLAIIQLFCGQTVPRLLGVLRVLQGGNAL